MIKGFPINCIPINRGGTVKSTLTDALPATLEAKFLFLWTGKYNGDNLLNDLGSEEIAVTGKDWITKYIPPITTATFAVPDNATFLGADGTDDFWFNVANTLLQKSHADLIANETERTFIKYSDFPPYNVYAIGILKDGEILTDEEKNIISKYFKLWIFYFGVFSDYGYLKDNRTIE